MAGAHDHGAAHGAHAAHAGHPTGWRRFVYSTNHKDIGTMYLVFAIAAGLVGAFLSMMMRAELMYPGMQIFAEPHTFNVFVTGHGLIMVFFLIMPALIGGLCTWVPPLLIRATCPALQRIDHFSI